MLSPTVPRGGETLGTRIRAARKAKGWTLEHLGTKLGVTKVSVWAWEQDRSRPREQVLNSLSVELGLGYEELVFGHRAVRLPHLVAECRQRIAAAVGLAAEDIQISVILDGVEHDVLACSLKL